MPAIVKAWFAIVVMVSSESSERASILNRDGGIVGQGLKPKQVLVIQVECSMQFNQLNDS